VTKASAPKPLLSQVAPTAPPTTPPFAVPPLTGIGPIAFVTGEGAGSKPTGKGKAK
jgi:hypothetical protein